MQVLESFAVGQLILFTFVLARVSGLVTTVPLFTGGSIPIQVRAILAVGLSLVLLPTQWGAPPPVANNVCDYAIMMASELLIGVSLGLGVVILMSGLQVAGQIIAQMSGMALADVLSPGTETEIPLFSSAFNMLAMAVFVVIGGHRAMIDALLSTFATLRVGQGGVEGSLAQTIVTLVSESFSLAIRAAAPAMVALLLSTLVLGLIGRTMPQLNVLVLGFGINSMVTLAVLMVSVGAVALLFQQYFEPALRMLVEALRPSG